MTQRRRRHHGRLDPSVIWTLQGFKNFGVGLSGISAIDGEAFSCSAYVDQSTELA